MYPDPCPSIMVQSDPNQSDPNQAVSNSDGYEFIGTVKNWGSGKYGFITSSTHDGQLYCHCSQLRNVQWLRKGDEVKYARRFDQRNSKWEAVNVHLIRTPKAGPKLTSRKRQNRSENSQPVGFRRNRAVGLTESERENLINASNSED